MKLGKNQKILIVSPHFDDFALAMGGTSIKLKNSKMAGKRYFANTCPKCGVLYGDFFLHAEPGAPFFPSDEQEAKSLYMKEIPLAKPVEIRAGLNLGLGEMILSNVKRI